MTDAPPFVIANFKANKTLEELISWLEQVEKNTQNFPGTVAVAPSHPFLAVLHQKIKSSGWRIKLAAQDISKFEQGAYTGEFAASQIKNICTYSIIGHSERRQNFKEDNEALSQKVKNAKSVQIEPIFCVQDENTDIPEGVAIVAYEPVFAIGTGNPDTPENAKSVAQNIKSRGQYTVIYGGSVNSQNAKTFLEKDLLDGLLVGKASLDAGEFIKILESTDY